MMMGKCNDLTYIVRSEIITQLLGLVCFSIYAAKTS
jgi:hypothetical protein